MKRQPNSNILSIVGRSIGYEGCYAIDGDTWVVSSIYKKMIPDKVDLVFNLHKPEVFEQWLPKDKAVTAFPFGENIYPVQEMLDKYGAVFGSSVSWMLALAIKMEYKTIYLFGLDMASKEEYINQRDTLYYMIGRAEALGINIIIPEESRIFFKDRIYGVL